MPPLPCIAVGLLAALCRGRRHFQLLLRILRKVTAPGQLHEAAWLGLRAHLGLQGRVLAWLTGQAAGTAHEYRIVADHRAGQGTDRGADHPEGPDLGGHFRLVHESMARCQQLLPRPGRLGRKDRASPRGGSVPARQQAAEPVVGVPAILGPGSLALASPDLGSSGGAQHWNSWAVAPGGVELP